jgi:2-desacetyl-2-hydroxyethyl bacteriochlorophyllide A dehydrogenase
MSDQAFWVQAPGQGELLPVELPEPGPDDVVVRTLYSAVSRGTESLVFHGKVPPSQHATMRAPFQEGEFPGPVKYGYLNVGVVEQGELRGQTVFCLYPHQSRYVVPASAVTVVPDEVPAERAVLAGTVETAVNAVWDANPMLGDRVAVVGAGMIGASIATVLAGFPAVRVQLVDVDPSRAELAASLGVEFATPDQARGDCDFVVHASATEAGLERSLELLGPDGVVHELSWYGDRPVRVPLGEWFHSRRLAVRASQVGAIATNRRGRRGHAERLALAMELLADDRFEALVAGECRFADLPELFSGELPALATRVIYNHR